MNGLNKYKNVSILDLPNNYDIINPLYKTSKWEDFCLEVEAKWCNLVTNVRSFFIGIHNIFIYAPIIWKTREWDYEFLLDLLEFKLTRMKTQIQKDNLVAETPTICKDISETLKYINRYKNHTEIFEIEHQNDLRKIIKEPNKQIQDELKSEYFAKSYKDETDTWNNIWNTIKNHMYEWWD